MANVHLGLLLALVTFHGVYQIVDAVACAKDSDCVSTDNVLPKCTSGLCECKSGFYPITTGCGTRLPKPTVSINGNDYGTTTEAYDKAKVTLKCQASVDDSEALRYVWSENGNIIAGKTGTGPLYQFTADINKHNVEYSCKATLPDALDSFDSDTFKITVISTDTAPSGNPRIFSRNIVVPGSQARLGCTDVPIGTPMSDIEFKDGNKTIEAKYGHTALVNSQFTCQYKGKISDPLEIIKDNSPKPTIEPRNKYNWKMTGPQEWTVVQGRNVGLSCGNDFGIKTSYYTNGVLIPTDASAYWFSVDTSTLGANVYSCSSQYTSQNGYKLKETKSDTWTIVVQADIPVRHPFIVVEPDNGNIGGHVSITCLTNAIGDLEYEWRKNDRTIYGQSDKIIQLHNVQLRSVSDYYRCRVSKNVQDSSSESKVAVTLPQPTLSVTGTTFTDPALLTAGKTFQLVCQLAAAPNGTEYRFYKGNHERIQGRLASVTQKDNGRYYCATYFYNVELSRSNELVISVAALPQPTLSVAGVTNPTKLTSGKTYRLVCRLAAAPKGTQYRFYKGAKRIPARIVSVQQKHNGRYTCETYINNVRMSRSNARVISVIA